MTIDYILGDSITFGSGSTSNLNTYPSLLHRQINLIIHEKYKINDVEFVVNNFGKGGTTVISTTAESYWNSTEYSKAIIRLVRHYSNNFYQLSQLYYYF